MDKITGDTAVRAAREVRVVFSRLRRRLRDVTTDRGGLTPSQLSVISLLERGGPSSASALAAIERVRPQSMAATLGVLEEQGLIARSPDPDDGRRQLVALSPAGREFIDGDRQERQEWLAQELRDSYTEDERQTILTALELLGRLA
jgi:DNA-binding MarR family transcriptional regulator